MIDTRQHDKTRSPGFCVHHNEARLRLLSVVRRYVDTFSRQITNVPPVCIKAIAILAGPDFPISGILFTGPLTIPSVDPKNRSPAILVRLGCSPVSFLALKSFISDAGVACAARKGEPSLSATIRNQFQAHCTAGAGSLSRRLRPLLGRLRRVLGNALGLMRRQQ